MLSEVLWPTGFQVRIDVIEVGETNQLIITACGIQERAWCPDCQQPSERINSHYCRHPADLPCGGYAIQLNLTVPRFFCDNEACPRRTFAGKFPELLKPYARRTNRLANRQQRVGFVVGGEAGGRVLDGLEMSASADTLIRLVRSLEEPVFETPRVLGVDDWAKRKGQSYGTILVNLETHQVVDLLDERSPESLSQWLEAHPGVEIISRDRGAEYKSGATLGAPESIQIADRFHLLQNLVEALKRMLEKQTKCLRQAARQVAAELKEVPSSPLELEEIAEGQAQIKCKPPTIHQLRFEEVKELQRQGWSQRAAAKQVGLSRETVRKYFEVNSYLQRSPVSQSTSTVTPYHAYLVKRWYEGCHNIRQLYTELEGQGYSGHYMSVYRAVQRLLADGQIQQVAAPAPVPVPIPPLSVSQAAWLLIHPDERLKELDCRLRDRLCESCQEIQTARQLALSFRELVRQRRPEQLDSWLLTAEESGILAFKNFVRGLRRDYPAVKAALTYEWSNGQVEGQVNRLKFIKRQMYGRAKFDLLRRRVLGIPSLA